MSCFIEQVVRVIFERYKDLSSLVLVLPNRRSAVILKRVLQERSPWTSTWLPEIYTMQELMQRISGLSLIEGLPLYLDFYTVVSRQPDVRGETFDKFIQWAPQVLSDFDEIDLNLVDTKRFFAYISSVDRINHWEPRDLAQQTLFIEKHFLFLKGLALWYDGLREWLLEKGMAYHGLIFRSALDRLDDFLLKNSDLERIIFIGMNALNRSEAILIQSLLERGKAETYWDVDAYYYEDEAQEAGAFVRSYFNTWPALRDQHVQWIAENFKKAKQVEVISTPGQVGQTKWVGHLLASLARQGENFSNVVVVPADGRLLIPLLHAIPKEISPLNVLMPYPLQAIPLGQSFLIIFCLFSNRERFGRDQFYHKDLLQLLSDIHLGSMLHEADRRFSALIIQNNISFVPDVLILEHLRGETFLGILDSKNKDPKVFLGMLIGLSQKIRGVFLEDDSGDHNMALEFLKHFNGWAQGLDQLLSKHPTSITEIKALDLLYKQWLRSEKVQFFGRNPGGLSLMGLLETCLLNFDTVIMTSVNEGIFPPEKTQCSWIPFNIRKRFGLPTYQEQDALYAYHFYHLLQRARKVYLVCNTEPDEYGSGEKSRFIHQLEIESPHEVHHKTVLPDSGDIERPIMLIEKSASVMHRLDQIATKGFSSSAIGLYISDPLLFYQRKVLGLNDHETVEESLEARGLGTIVHQVLETLYRPIQGRLLTLEALQEMKNLHNSIVERFFQEIGADHRRGKNLLIYRVVKQYVEDLIAWDEMVVQQGQQIVIQTLECALSTPLRISLRQVRLYGLIDRVDICDGLLRIIDYKTGTVKPKELEIASTDFEELVQVPDHSKALQLLIYAQLWLTSGQGTKVVYPGIISLRKIEQGLIPLSIDKDQAITPEIVEGFLPHLSAKLTELLDPEVPFVKNLGKDQIILP
ncbi:MAG: PD-(D/E)XK nuclease family protein [Flavobacteriales bacterium AspAUS03]